MGLVIISLECIFLLSKNYTDLEIFIALEDISPEHVVCCAYGNTINGNLSNSIQTTHNQVDHIVLQETGINWKGMCITNYLLLVTNLRLLDTYASKIAKIYNLKS